jgi:hypothetical protein
MQPQTVNTRQCTRSVAKVLAELQTDDRFRDENAIARLAYRDSPYWHVLWTCRHLGIHKPDGRVCNWTARVLTRNKRYVQHCLGPALDWFDKLEADH